MCVCARVAGLDLHKLPYTTSGSHEQMAEVMCCKKSNTLSQTCTLLLYHPWNEPLPWQYS